MMNKANQIPWCCWLPSYYLSVPLPSIHICFMIPGHDPPIFPLLPGSAREEEQRACVLCPQSLPPSGWYQSPLSLLLMFWHCQNQLTVSSYKTSASQQAPPLHEQDRAFPLSFWILTPTASPCPLAAGAPLPAGIYLHFLVSPLLF